MKAPVVAAIFAAAFVTVTGALMFLNQQYNNIWQFDFSEPKKEIINKEKKSKVEEKPKDLVEFIENDINAINAANDSAVIASFDNKEINNDNKVNKPNEDVDNTAKVLTDSIQVLKQELSKLKNKKPASEVPANKSELQQAAATQKNSEEYTKWLKKTAALYEAMDAKKAAKIIENYSDNVAKDIIYSMKKKKAAEVLSALRPEIATKIASAK